MNLFHKAFTFPAITTFLLLSIVLYERKHRWELYQHPVGSTISKGTAAGANGALLLRAKATESPCEAARW